MSCGVCQRTFYYEECSQCNCDVCEDCERKLNTCEECNMERLCPDCIDPHNHECESDDVDDEEEE